MFYTILVVVQVVVALSLIGLILVQHGKGADAGAAFGSGASGTVFGAKGSANFLSRATAALATVFFVASLSLAYLVNGQSTGGSSSVTDQLTQGKPAATAPASNGGDASEAATNGQATEQVQHGETAQPSGKTANGGTSQGSKQTSAQNKPQNKSQHNSSNNSTPRIPD